MVVFAKPIYEQPMFLHTIMRGDWRLAMGIGLSFALKLLEDSCFRISDLHECSLCLRRYAVSELITVERFAFSVTDYSYLLLERHLNVFRSSLQCDRPVLSSLEACSAPGALEVANHIG